MLSLSERLSIALALAIDIALALAIGTGLALGLANAHDAKEKPEIDEHGVRRAEVFSHPFRKQPIATSASSPSSTLPARNPRSTATTSRSSRTSCKGPWKVNTKALDTC